MGKAGVNTHNAAIAYYRVSTAKQGVSGLGLEAQRETVTGYAQRAGLVIAGEFTEVETAKGARAAKRVQIHAALAECKRTGATLLIAKLDRLSRNVHFISGLMESGVNFVACDNPSVTPLTLHVLAAVAEQEAKAISTRTRDALAAAKRRGVKLGKAENLTTEAQAAGAEANAAGARRAYAAEVNYVRMMHESGKSLGEIAAQLNADGKTTRTGKPYARMTVQRIMRRAGISTAAVKK